MKKTDEWVKKFDKKFCVPCIDHRLPDKALIDDRKGVLMFIRQEIAHALVEREREILKHIQIMAEYIGINTEKVIRLRNLIAYLSHLQQKENV